MKQVFPHWKGETCVILASGPSLKQFIESPQGARGLPDTKIVAVNSTYRWAPFADVIYAGDFMWWKQNITDVRRAQSGFTQLWTCDRAAAERWDLNWVKGVNRLGLGKDKFIHTNGNSGAQAINLAYVFGCRRILLLGFDMKLGPAGERHHHADHPAPMVQAQTFGDWIHKSEFLARELEEAGCSVVNCSAETALTCWPRSTIEKELS